MVLETFIEAEVKVFMVEMVAGFQNLLVIFCYHRFNTNYMGGAISAHSSHFVSSPHFGYNAMISPSTGSSASTQFPPPAVHFPSSTSTFSNIGPHTYL